MNILKHSICGILTKNDDPNCHGQLGLSWKCQNVNPPNTPNGFWNIQNWGSNDGPNSFVCEQFQHEASGHDFSPDTAVNNVSRLRYIVALTFSIQGDTPNLHFLV